MADTAKERKRNARARDRSLGIREVLIRIPQENIGELRTLARKRMQEWEDRRK